MIMLKSFMDSLSLFIKVIKRSKLSMLGFIILLGYLVMATVGPEIIPYSEKSNPKEIFLPPSWEHPLGTDYAGRDVLQQIVHGSRPILLVATLTALISVMVAIAVGMVAGFKGGIVDAVLMVVVDIMLTIPGFPLLIVLATTLLKGSTNPFALAFILSITSWASLARAIRSQVLTLRERDFIEAAKLLDLGTFHIIIRELLPNMMAYVIINFMLSIINAIYNMVGLFIIGLLPFEAQNWGLMIQLGITHAGSLFSARTAYYLITPIVAIVLLQVGIVLFSRSIEEYFNPRLRGSKK